MRKSAARGRPPTLGDYEQARQSFSWDAERAALTRLAHGGINIANETVVRHGLGRLRNQAALRWLSKDGARRDLSYVELHEKSDRFANVLRGLGVRRGERVFVLLGRVPELYVACLGALKAGAVFCPLFSAFGPEPIRSRLELGAGKLLVTSDALYERKVEASRRELPALEHVLLVRAPGDSAPLPAGTLDFATAMRSAADRFDIAEMAPDEMALLHFTSGTTGKPKGAVHVHEAVVAHRATGRLALDLNEGDVFWCTADPGWVTGTSYGILSPLANGATLLVDEAEFDPERWYRTLAAEQVNVWYTSPTAARLLMAAGDALARQAKLDSVRLIASVGEPLNPEAVIWSSRVLGQPIHDNWWQTETGGIMISNFRSMEIRPGSMGRPLPGVDAAVVRRIDEGRVEPISDPDVEGELALRPGWPSMFRAYLNDDARYRRCFASGWYLTGDLARVDADGYFWFVGRADDMIKSSGHLIGPFEVESALLENPAVAEAAAIGKPDPIAGEVVKAFVSLKPGYASSDALKKELLASARSRLGAVVAPKELAFLPALPRTRSGKIMRRLLKARELGLPEGDTSTLEAGA